MFFLPLISGFFWLYILAAILPAIFLMIFIYRLDKVEKEPGRMLLGLIFRGILAAVISSVLERIAGAVLNITPLSPESFTYVAVFAFLVVAAVEEGMKFLLCFRRTWKDVNFNCRFDGVVYMAFTSLGFAAIENIIYVFQYGLAVALPRALLSVPGHLGFAIAAGALYGRAKQFGQQGQLRKKTACLIFSYAAAVLLHGFYDTCAMLQTGISTVVFYVFVIVMYILLFRLLKRESGTDLYFDQ